MPMIWNKPAISAIVALVLSLSPGLQSGKPLAQTDVETGLIDGTVVYEDGIPTKGATVYAYPLGRPMATIIPQADTDEIGYFRIEIPSLNNSRF